MYSDICLCKARGTRIMYAVTIATTLDSSNLPGEIND